MAKGNKVQNFNKTSAHRDSMLRNMTLSLVHYEVIRTTSAKSMALRDYFEKFMFRAKKNDEQARRYVKSLTTDKIAIKKIFETLVPRYADRATGFVSVKKVGIRPSDSSEMSEVSLVDGKKALHIIKPKKIKKAKPAAKAKPEAKKPEKQEVKKAEAKKAAKKSEVTPKVEEKAEKPGVKATEKSETKEAPKENLAQRLGKFLGFKSRSSVRPEDDK
jgi:large subunit ribosomal protein L17